MRICNPMTRVTYEVQVLLDMTCGSRQRFHRRVVTPLQVTSPFLGLFLRTQSNGLSIGVGICGLCQSSSPGFRRSHTQCFHRLLLEVVGLNSVRNFVRSWGFKLGYMENWMNCTEMVGKTE